MDGFPYSKCSNNHFHYSAHFARSSSSSIPISDFRFAGIAVIFCWSRTCANIQKKKNSTCANIPKTKKTVLFCWNWILANISKDNIQYFLLKQNLCKHSKDQNQYFLLKHNFSKHPRDKKQQHSTADQATTPTTTLPTSTKKYKNQTHRERLKTFDGLFHSGFYPFKPLCHLRNISIGMDLLMSCWLHNNWNGCWQLIKHYYFVLPYHWSKNCCLNILWTKPVVLSIKLF